MKHFSFPYKADDLVAISDGGNCLSMKELSLQAQRISALMGEKSLVLCLCQNTIPCLVGYYAFLTGNHVAIMLDASKGTETYESYISNYNPGYIWTPENSDFPKNGWQEVLRYESYILLKTTTKQCDSLHPDLQLLLTTSGSTGSPKLVRLSQKNLLSNAESIAEYLGITDEERPITSLPMYYSYGLSVINSHLIKGSTILLTDKGIMQKEFWEFAKEQAASSLAGVPYTYEMLRRLRVFRMDLPALKTFTQAGGKLKAELVREFIEASQQAGKRFIVMYGQTEATARMSYLPENNSLEKYASIGIAIPGGQFSLISADGATITDADTEGELVYTGSNVSMGYAECAADLALGDENQGILRTGDLARRDIDGYYYITGRLKRFVKIWGNRCNLDAVEQICKSVTSNCACTGVDDKITIYVTEDGHTEELLTRLTSKTGFNVRAFAVRRVDSIPKNEAGKVQYAELSKL